MLNLVSAKITGVPGQSGWSQVHDFFPEDEEKQKLRGHLFAVVSTSRFEEGVDKAESGRELILRLHEEYFGNLEAKAFNALKAAVEKVTQEFSTSWGDIEIVATAFVDNVCYCAASGGSQVSILRDGMLASILESRDGETVSASGYPKDGDAMILGTHELFGKVPQGIIKAGLEEKDSESLIETFGQVFHKEENSGKMAAVVVRFEEKMFSNSYVAPSIVSSEEKPKINFQNPLTKFQTPAKEIFSKLFKRATNAVPERRIYIKDSSEFEAESKSKNLTLSVGVILLVILGISIVFGIRQKNLKEVRSQYEGKLTEASQNLDEAIGLAGVSPDRARELFISSQEKLSEVEALNVKDPKIDELRARIEEQKGITFGEYKADTNLFLDLTLLSSGFKGDDISSSEGNLFILDKSGKKIISVELDTKKSKVVAGPDKIGDVASLASYSDRVFILDNDGVKEVSGDTNTVIEKDWSGEALVYGFAGNLYVLDKDAGLIYRYAGSGNSFGGKQNWLSASTKPDFGSAKTWVIDGAVYVLNSQGRIQKFSLGSPQAFSMNGVYPEISSVNAVYSSDETEFVYLLDVPGKRIVVLDKKGAYKAQYLSDDISNAKGLMVSEADGKIILVTGEKLLSIDLKHL